MNTEILQITELRSLHNSVIKYNSVLRTPLYLITLGLSRRRENPEAVIVEK